MRLSESIFIDEPHELLKAPKTTFAHAKQAFGQFIVVFSQCFFNTIQNGLDETNDSYD